MAWTSKPDRRGTSLDIRESHPDRNQAFACKRRWSRKLQSPAEAKSSHKATTPLTTDGSAPSETRSLNRAFVSIVHKTGDGRHVTSHQPAFLPAHEKKRQSPLCCDLYCTLSGGLKAHGLFVASLWRNWTLLAGQPTHLVESQPGGRNGIARNPQADIAGTWRGQDSNCTDSYLDRKLMKRSRRPRFRSALVLALLLATAVTAQTEESATVVPADTADSNTGAPVATDATPATVVPAGGSTDAASSSANTPAQTPVTEAPTTAPVATELPATPAPETTAPATTAPETPVPGTPAPETTAPVTAAPETPVPVATETPAPTTAAPTITASAAETAAPTTAPVTTEAPTAVPVATTPAPVATPAPPVTDASPATAAPVPTEAPTAPTVAPATDAPTAGPVPTEAPTAAPAPTEAPTTALPATEAPTTAPVATEAPTTAPVATEAPTAAPATPAAPVTTSPATTAPVATTPTPTASSPAPATTIPTPTTAAPTATPTSSPPPATPQPAASSSSSDSNSATGSSTSASAASSMSSKSSGVSQSSGNSATDTSNSDSVGNSGGLTFAPITSDEGDTGTDAGADTTASSKGSDPTNASTSSGQSESFGGWKLAIVIVGAVCAVLASVFFVHMRHVRAAAANKRDRGSSQQRALDSFFRRNRVTVARDTGASSGNFVTDPLTPRDEIAVTMPSNSALDRPRTKTADLIAGSTAQAFNRRTRPGSGAGSNASIETPTESYNGDDYNSFIGRHNAPSVVSTDSSNFYRSDSSNVYGADSMYSDSSSVSLGSIAPSVSSSQRSAQMPMFPTRLETVAASTRSSKRASSATSIGDVRDTNRSDRSSSDFSVFNPSSVSSSDDDIYRMSTQLIDVSAIPVTTSEKSEPKNSYSSDRMSEALSEFSVAESYTSELSGNESFATELSINESFATEGSFRTDDSFATVDSFATQSTQDTESDMYNRDSDLVIRNSKESELSEGEI
ncbi:hypothetical protein P3T76_006056 [Phytophthora citrophthora]|uniref:Uncharacterized protein n=1 Tax=Phytophthora citrophthora TaxID=4793 RepID=A0AAD9GPV9_9STRA|nr:hypothetical protein P3T76_006056 [Phytophthora citrophthora]